MLSVSTLSRLVTIFTIFDFFQEQLDGYLNLASKTLNDINYLIKKTSNKLTQKELEEFAIEVHSVHLGLA